MDLVQLSILRAGGVYFDEQAVGEWERLHDRPVPRLAAAKAEPNRLLQGLAALVISLSNGLAGLGQRLQERAAKSAQNTAANGYKAT